jgi:hypothetical protein
MSLTYTGMLVREVAQLVLSFSIHEPTLYEQTKHLVWLKIILNLRFAQWSELCKQKGSEE